MFNRIMEFALLLALAVTVGACGKKVEEEGAGRYGMLSENSPEYAAVRFMRSIYQDPNIDAAVDLSTDKLARILQSYHTNRNVQRHLLNLKYDKVTITSEGSSRVGRSEYAEKATVTIFFSGTYNSQKIEDLRSINLIKDNGKWKVDSVQPDKFM